LLLSFNSEARTSSRFPLCQGRLPTHLHHWEFRPSTFFQFL